MDLRQIITAVIILGLTSLIIRLVLNRKIRTEKLLRWWRLIAEKLHDHQILQIPEINDNFQENNLFRRVYLYLNSLESLEDSDFTNLFSGVNPNDIVLTLNIDQTVFDTFLGARVRWRCGVAGECRAFTLEIRKRDKRRVLRSYLQHIHAVSDEIERVKRELRLFTLANSGRRWRSVPFTHPATFDTVVMDADVKLRIKVDIETFLKSKQYYHRLGRVWRRSYLLYGPSGTGKSTFAAALTKSMSYDVYDIDLSKVSDDGDLKSLLLRTTPKSVILMEDFDKYIAGKCRNISPENSSENVPENISGVLNFMDGVVNSCCDERVMIFTMTSKDEIAPALLRPGRVDVHLHFPNCDFNRFKTLANNYLGLRDHKLFPQVEEIFSSGATLSPAEVGELMMVNRSSSSRAIKSVISALQTTTTTNSLSAVVPVGGNGSCKSTPRNGVSSGRISVDGLSDGGGGKEFRKLYGLLRRKSNLSKSQSFDLGTT
ncbi:hypothetical protein vseg_019090 [Gypsophila vaccaria]